MKKTIAILIISVALISPIAEAKVTPKKIVHKTNTKTATSTATSTKSSNLHGLGLSIITGQVTSINSTTLLVSDARYHTYSVDVSKAKIIQGADTATLAVIKIGDRIIIQGTTSTSTIQAANIIDQTMTAPLPDKNDDVPHGLWGHIVAFFTHLFK